MANDLLVPPAEPTGEQLGARRKVVTVVALLAAIGALVALAFSGYWLTHPNRMTYGNLIGTRIPVDEPVVMGIYVSTEDPGIDGDTDPVPVTLTGVEPRVEVNTADASLEILLCELGPGARIGNIGTSSVRYLERVCAGLRPVDQPVENFTGTGGFLVLVVTPRQPGLVRVDGFDTTYRDGIRWGSDQAGVELVVRVKGT